jgi:hypothetical protein
LRGTAAVEIGLRLKNQYFKKNDEKNDGELGQDNPNVINILPVKY